MRIGKRTYNLNNMSKADKIKLGILKEVKKEKSEKKKPLESTKK